MAGSGLPTGALQRHWSPLVRFKPTALARARARYTIYSTWHGTATARRNHKPCTPDHRPPRASVHHRAAGPRSTLDSLQLFSRAPSHLPDACRRHLASSPPHPLVDSNIVLPVHPRCPSLRDLRSKPSEALLLLYHTTPSLNVLCSKVYPIYLPFRSGPLYTSPSFFDSIRSRSSTRLICLHALPIAS